MEESKVEKSELPESIIVVQRGGERVNHEDGSLEASPPSLDSEGGKRRDVPYDWLIRSTDRRKCLHFGQPSDGLSTLLAPSIDTMTPLRLKK
jgi:hypothetical protein